jgi:hypothetical protein
MNPRARLSGPAVGRRRDRNLLSRTKKIATEDSRLYKISQVSRYASFGWRASSNRFPGSFNGRRRRTKQTTNNRNSRSHFGAPDRLISDLGSGAKFGGGTPGFGAGSGTDSGAPANRSRFGSGIRPGIGVAGFAATPAFGSR